MNGDSVSSSATPPDSSHMDTATDGLSQDDRLVSPLQDDGRARDEPFSPSLIKNLPNMSVEQLSKLESQLSREFSELSRDYTDARRTRIDYLLKNVNSQIKTFQDNDADWTDLYLNQLSALEDYVAHPEEAMQHSKEFQELLESIKLPWELDDLFNTRRHELPFAKYFQRIIQPHQNELMALDNLKNYSTRLVDLLAEKNKMILWNQYRADVAEHKEKLVTQTYEELAQLHREFYGVNSNEMLSLDNKSYYRSVVPAPIPELTESTPIRLSSKNIDSFNDFDNVYYKKHKIEITSTKYEALDGLHSFATEQNKYKIPQLDTAHVRLAGCMGLTEADIDADLALLRFHKDNQSKDSTSREFIEKGMDSEKLPQNSTESERLLYRSVLDLKKKDSEVPLVPLDSLPLTNDTKGHVANNASF